LSGHYLFLGEIHPVGADEDGIDPAHDNTENGYDHEKLDQGEALAAT
jgi:hypothetical protein